MLSVLVEKEDGDSGCNVFVMMPFAQKNGGWDMHVCVCMQVRHLQSIFLIHIVWQHVETNHDFCLIPPPPEQKKHFASHLSLLKFTRMPYH